MQKVIIFDFNRTLYDPDTQSLYPGAGDLLRRLSESHIPLYILGKQGESREALVHDVGIAHYFRESIFVSEKTQEQLKNIQNQYPEGTLFYSIGDRIKKEIYLGNCLGFKTIWFRNGKFATEIAEQAMEQPWKIIENLMDVLAII